MPSYFCIKNFPGFSSVGLKGLAIGRQGAISCTPLAFYCTSSAGFSITWRPHFSYNENVKETFILLDCALSMSTHFLTSNIFFHQFTNNAQVPPLADATSKSPRTTTCSPFTTTSASSTWTTGTTWTSSVTWASLITAECLRVATISLSIRGFIQSGLFGTKMESWKCSYQRI